MKVEIYQTDVSTLKDNEYLYLTRLEAVINSVDENSKCVIYKKPHAFVVRILPSKEKIIPLFMKEIIKFHKFLSIRVDFGKSIKNTGIIYYEIPLLED